MVASTVSSKQNAVARVTSLPLVSSTYDLVSSVYSNTKSTHPYIKSVCEAAEQGVWTLTSVAYTTASPIIDKLEPQIAIANDLACKGLDRIEKSLPILRQPSKQIVSSARGVVTDRVSGAKDSVSDTLSSVVEKTRGKVQDGMVKTKAVVSGSVSTVLESRVARLVSCGMDTALATSEHLVERYLPLTEDELELEAKAVTGFDRKEQSYYVRLGCLSSKLRQRASSRALTKISEAKQRSLGYISELNSTVDMISFGRRNIDGANQLVNQKLNSLVVWTSGVTNPDNSHKAEVIESQTLALARNLTQQLQTTSLFLVSSLQGLPSHVQQEVFSLGSSATQLYTSFRHANVLADLPDSVLTNSKIQLARSKNSLDNIMDYMVNNTPLNWLVGPFYPRMAPEITMTPDTPSHSTSKLEQEGPMMVEMDSLPPHPQ